MLRIDGNGPRETIARRLVLGKLAQLKVGHVTIVDGIESWSFGEAEEEAMFKATILVTNSAFYSDIAFGGSVGAGESYMQAHWRCSDLVSLVRILLRNRHVLEGMETGLARLTRPLQKLFHWVNRNTREGARRNISAHYDPDTVKIKRICCALQVKFGSTPSVDRSACLPGTGKARDKSLTLNPP